jgi:hypothetical protein
MDLPVVDDLDNDAGDAIEADIGDLRRSGPVPKMDPKIGDNRSSAADDRGEIRDERAGVPVRTRAVIWVPSVDVA